MPASKKAKAETGESSSKRTLRSASDMSEFIDGEFTSLTKELEKKLEQIKLDVEEFHNKKVDEKVAMTRSELAKVKSERDALSRQLQGYFNGDYGFTTVSKAGESSEDAKKKLEEEIAGMGWKLLSGKAEEMGVSAEEILRKSMLQTPRMRSKS